MTQPEQVQLAVLKNDVDHIREDVSELKAMVTEMHNAFIEDKGARKAKGAIFWGSVGFVAYIGSNIHAILNFFKGA